MDKREMANQLVADFGRLLTVEDLHLHEETDSCVLVFEDSLILNIEYDDVTERLVFAIFLEELPAEGAEPLLRQLMGANLYWHRTGGATLCLEEGTKGIILVYSHEVTTLVAASFENVVENMVNQAEKWRKIISSFQPESAAPSVPPPAEGGLAHIFG